MSQLADLIERYTEEISQRFAVRSKETFVAQSLDDEQVIDSLRDFLDEIVHGLRAEESQSAEASSLTFDELQVLAKYLIGGVADAATRYAQERDEALRQQTSKPLGFLAHELRNRLSTMRMAFGMLQKQQGCLSEVRPMFVLEKGFTQVQSLIDDALVEVRLGGRATLALTKVSIPDLLGALSRESALEADAKDIELRLETEPCTACADEKLLRSVLSNLIGNAIKFTHAGQVVFVRARSADHRVIIEVEDRCGGLPAERIQTIFDPFVQVGRDRSGFGLGLAIAKQAVDAHEGALRVHNLGAEAASSCSSSRKRALPGAAEAREATYLGCAPRTSSP